MSATEQGVLNMQWNAANEAYAAEHDRRAPHVLMRPRLFPDGDQWCALYGDSLMSGVSGFGDTPAAACAAFDDAWNNGAPPTPKKRPTDIEVATEVRDIIRAGRGRVEAIRYMRGATGMGLKEAKSWFEGIVAESGLCVRCGANRGADRPDGCRDPACP